MNISVGNPPNTGSGTVAARLMRALRDRGVSAVFGYPGQSNIVLLHAARAAGMHYVQSADERSAAFAACGFLLSTLQPVVVCVSKGPGATNLLTSLLSANKDGVPLFVICGNVGESYRHRNSFQEFDPVSAFAAAGAIKAASYCASPNEVMNRLHELFDAAWTAPFGPVLLDLPDNILGAPLELDLVSTTRAPIAREVCEFDGSVQVSAAVDLLTEAKRPLIVVGRGGRHDADQIREFCSTRAIPAVHTVGGTGVVSTEDMWYGGLLRHNGHESAASLVQDADLIAALGTGLDERATGRRADFAPGATHIHVDLDAEVLNRQTHADVRLRMSIADFLTTVSARVPRSAGRRGWQVDRWASPRATQQLREEGPLSAREIVAAASATLRDAIVVKDSGSHKYWMTKYAPCLSPQQSISSCHFGAMGFGLPAAIGAALGSPGRDVVVACGDGCLLMSIADLETVVREGCSNLKIVVFNNGGLGSTRDLERRMRLDEHYVSDCRGYLPLARYAAAFGIESHVISDRNQLQEFSTLLATPGLRLFDCRLDTTEVLSPAVPYSEALSALAIRDSQSVCDPA
ncbi:MAG: thiamine pyrophosphate-binding protein [Cyanobacteria bacterium]|nr:thiamine pyrophosphate-binding protein [Cyanobacteriota bacterium]